MAVEQASCDPQKKTRKKREAAVCVCKENREEKGGGRERVLGVFKTIDW